MNSDIIIVEDNLPLPEPKLSFKGTNLRAFWCPSCDKQRLLRPLDFNKELLNEVKKYKDRDGNEIKLLYHICDFCDKRNYKKYFEPTKADAKKVLKALQEGELEGDKSLEEML